MPHFIIEYSTKLEQNTPIPAVVNAVFDGALLSGLFKEQDIKVRAYPCSFYKTALENNSFCHVTGRILPGRTDDQKQHLSQVILNNIEPLITDVGITTVEILDMDRNSYLKVI